MRIPDLDPRKRIVFKTTQAIRALQVAPATWYRYTKLLGLKGQRRGAYNTYWWTYDQVMQVFQAMVQEHMRRKNFLE